MVRITFNFFIYIFEMLIAFAFFSKNYSKRFKSNIKILAIGFLLFMSGATLFVLFNNEIINLAVFFIINMVFATICFEISVKSAIVQSILLDAVMYCSELFVIFLCSATIKIPTNTYKNNLMVYIILCSICKILYLLVSQITALIIKKDKFENFKNKYFIPLFAFPILTIMTCSVLLFIALKVELPSSYQVAIFVINVLFIFTCVLAFIYYQVLTDKETRIKEMEIEWQKKEADSKHLQIIEQNNKNLGILVHDIKNHLIQIRSMENAEEIHNYVDSVAEEVQGYGYIGMSKNKTLDLIISKYINLCEGSDIKISFDVKTANLKRIAPTDISTIINNLLDNAVEAAGKSTEKIISVSIFKKQNYEIIKIQNSCDTKPISKGDVLLTTKKDKSLHGYGTQSVIKTVNKYDGIFCWEYLENENIFDVIVMLPI